MNDRPRSCLLAARASRYFGIRDSFEGGGAPAARLRKPPEDQIPLAWIAVGFKPSLRPQLTVHSAPSDERLLGRYDAELEHARRGGQVDHGHHARGDVVGGDEPLGLFPTSNLVGRQQIRQNIPRMDGTDSDVMLPPVKRKTTRQARDGKLGGCVRRRVWPWTLRCDAAYVYNATATMLHHLLERLARTDEWTDNVHAQNLGKYLCTQSLRWPAFHDARRVDEQ